ERELGIALHLYDDGSVLVLGSTNSSDLYSTPGAFCETYVRTFPMDNPYIDALFLAKVNPSLDSLAFLSYVNGFSTSSIESGLASIAVDRSGFIYLAMTTDWPDLPMKAGGFSTTFNGETDCAVLKFNPSCSNLIHSTFLGGAQVDGPSDMVVDSRGRPWIVGATHSNDFPTTPDPYQSRPSFTGNGFLTALERDFSALNYSTYFGASHYTAFDGIRLDESAEKCFILGGTSAVDLPVTDGCFNPIYPGGGDPFAVVFNLTVQDLEYCSYLGGSDGEGVHPKSMTLDGNGRMVIVGWTHSYDFPLSPGANSTTRAGQQDGFAMVLDPTPLDVPSPPSEVRLEVNDTLVNVSWEPPGITEGRIVGHRVYRGRTVGGMMPIKDVGTDKYFFKDRTVVNGIEYHYSVSAINSAGEGAASEPLSAMPFGLPSEPLDLNGTTGDGTVVLNWSAPLDPGGLEILGYHIHRGEGTDDPAHYRKLGNVTTFIDDAVMRGTSYVYSVAAFTNAGNSSLTPPLNITAEGTPDPTYLFPLEPSDQRVVLRWNAPVNDGGRELEGYHVYRGRDPRDLSLLTTLGPGETEHIDGGLENGVEYYYRMVAFNAHGPGMATSIQPVTPIGLPGAPGDLRSIPSNGSVTLTWSPPDLDGGSPIVSYMVYVGGSRGSISLFTELGPVVSYQDTDLTNGVTLFYAISAVNELGEGSLSVIVETTPYGRPGTPTGLSAENDVSGILLEWGRPVVTGGATSLTYRILRGSSPSNLEPLTDVVGDTTYLDTLVSGREEYHYAVRAVNPIGDASDRTPVISIMAVLGPGPVPGAIAERGDGQVTLSWATPLDEGGSPINGYIIFRGPTEADLTEVVRPGNVLSHTDRTLVNGRTYFYAIAAFNDVGPGELSMVVNATPVPVPGMPRELEATYSGDGVVLEWLSPEAGDTAPVTGYRVYRRAEGGSMELLVELGPVLSYTDGTVQTGNVYYYSVAAVNDVGEGPWRTSPQVSTGASTWWVSLLIAMALLVVVALGLVLSRRRSAEGREGQVDLGEEGSSPAEALNIIEEVYLVYGDGRLIATCSREECKTQDADLTSSMLIAIQGMVQEGLEKGGELESIKSGENIVMIEKGVHLNLAVVIYGRPDDELKEELENTVVQIEGTYAGVVEDWSGDRDVFDGVEEILERLLASTAYLTREDLDAAMARYQVGLLSALDLYRGYVRLKVAAMNATKDSVSDATIEVHYDPTMLRLERVEPDTLELHGDSVDLGNVKAGEKRTVSFLFDPLICQETHIDGTIAYRDTGGELLRTSMKRRHAKVVCPIFFTKEHASTATLLRLVHDELEMLDSRVFRYPATLSPRQAHQVGKMALSGGKMQLVREYAESGPPFEVETWYYGETQVKGYKIVMRLRVLEEDRLLEFFAASSAMEPVTGLLAEFRRDLLDIMREKYRVEEVEEVARDGSLRRTLEERELLIHQ
ncbi:MAG: hypothetical protein JSW25_10510, partial [Thermoplasmata archaeon]